MLFFWILRTGAPWRDLPQEYGKWGTVHQRFIRWRDKRLWEKLLEILINEPDFEWLMIDASHVKVHPHAAGARGGNQGMGAYRLNTKNHLAVDAHGLPVRMFVTAGTTADCTQAGELVEDINAETLIADKGYDTDEIVNRAQEIGMQMVIPPKKNRKQQRKYDKAIYRVRHLIENAFLHLKRWRGIATRYAKTLASFTAAVQIRCLALWLDVLS